MWRQRGPAARAAFARPSRAAKQAGRRAQEPLIVQPPIRIARPEARPAVAELFLSSSGRLSRSAFAAGIAPVLGALWLYGRWAEGAVRLASAWLVLPALLFSGCCLVSRRLHDLGRAGWWTAYPLALLLAGWPRPIGHLGWVCAAMLAILVGWLCVMRGERRANRFGAPWPQR